MRFSLLLFVLFYCVECGQASELDTNGCRVLSKIPKPGIHPRVFFTADEYPKMRERLNDPQFKAFFGSAHKQAIERVKQQWGEFGKLDLTKPSDEEILRYFTNGEGRNIDWGVASVTSVLMQDKELQELMKGVIVNYAHIILASQQRSKDEGFSKLSKELQDRLKIWQSDRFDVGVSWTLGAAGYAVSYDVLYAYMTDQQRDIIRKAIATATRGRKSYGYNMPRGYASSNHYGYHGDLLVMLAAIEGEPGFDQPTYDGIEKVLRDYWEIAYTPFGVSREDAYGPNVGLRGGGRGYMALARRGYNIFATRKFRRYLNYIAMEYDPYPGGHINGGASGGPDIELYPTSTLLSRYMYPDNPAANFNLRQMVGEEYERRLRWQGLLDYLVFGAAWKGPMSREEMLKSCELPLSVYYPVRGKFIARSDWSNDAMYLTLDARPDAHLIGHDKVDRGNFSMSALGRVWAFCGDFHSFNESRENSLVHIDGLAQPWKAPSVRFLWNEQHTDIAAAGVDLKYAYDWQWTRPWPKWGAKFEAPWEPETQSPIDLGWPKQFFNEDLCPKSIHGSETGYAGTNNLHRRPYNHVQKANRTVALIRGKQSYMLVCDDIRKDDIPHLYQWIMQVPTDLEHTTSTGGDIVLKESKGNRRLLVRFLQQQKCSTTLESYVANKHPKRKTTIHGKRLIAALKSVEPGFKVMLYPYREGSPLPDTKWDTDRTELLVSFPGQKHKLTFTKSAKTGIQVKIAK